MNIASVPCRCGHSCTASAPAFESASAMPCSTARVSICSQRPDAARAPQHDPASRPGAASRSRTPRCRRASARRQRRRAARPAARASCGDIARLLAPARLRPPAQGAEPGARRVEQDAVERSGCAGRRACRPSPTTSAPGRTRRGPCAPARRAPATTSLATRVAPPRAASARAARPCRPGRRTGRASAPPASTGRARLRASAASCEPSSCTRARPSRTASGFGRVAALEHSARTGENARLGSPALLHAGEPGQRDQAHRAARTLSAASSCFELVSRGPRPTAPDGTRGRSRLRMRVLERQAARPRSSDCLEHVERAIVRAWSASMVRSTPLTKPVADFEPTVLRQRDRLIDRGVLGDPQRQQLVAGQPQHVEHGRVDLSAARSRPRSITSS